MNKTHITLSTAIVLLALIANVTGVGAHEGEEIASPTAQADIETEAEAEADASATTRDPDSDDDGLDDGSEDQSSNGSDEEEAESDNSQDENRPVEVGIGAEGSAEAEAGATTSPAEATPSAIKELDKASPKLMDALSIDQSSPLLYQGVSIRAGGERCAEGEDCDDEDPTTPPSPREFSIEVSGQEVRGWNPEQKEEVQARLTAAGEVTTANDLGIRVASAALENEDVVDIATSPTSTVATYTTTVKLFGFIPKQVTATAHAEAGGDVSVDYPWYGFLSSKGEQSAVASLVADIRASHDVMISVEEEGVKRTIREEEDESQ